jgi:hypothetical protein
MSFFKITYFSYICDLSHGNVFWSFRKARVAHRMTKGKIDNYRGDNFCKLIDIAPIWMGPKAPKINRPPVDQKSKRPVTWG